MEKQCKADKCERTDIKAKGYCNLHWQRLRRNGTLEPKMLKNGPRSKYPEEYKSWEGMLQRCYVKSNKAYANYGGRGIHVCDRWREKPYGFSNFIDDMGPKPSYARTATKSRPLYSIDRIDYDKDYCPENCRWATWLEQESNRRGNSNNPGIHKHCRLWIARHRTASVNIRGSFPTEKMAIEAKNEWEKKYPL